MKKRELLLFTTIIFLAAIFLLIIFLSGVMGVGPVLWLTVILTVVALTVFFKPFYGLILYIMMVYLIPHHYILALKKIRVMLLLASLILLVFFIHKVFKRESINAFSSRLKLLISILLVLVFVSNIANFRFDAAWEGGQEFLTVFFLFFIIVNLIQNFDELRKACNAIIFCTVLIAINGLIMAFRGYGLMGNIPVNKRIMWTTTSHFGDPNDFALTLLIVFPFILVNLFEKNSSKVKKIGLFVLAAILLMAIYYTNSRGGFIGLMAIMVFFSVKRWGLQKGIIVAVGLMVISVLLAPSRMSNLSPYESSASNRIDAWIAGLSMLKTNPIFGIGYDQFIHRYGDLTAHSAYILCMAELGLVGYFVWLALIYSSYTGLRNIEKGGTEIQVKYAGILRLSLIGFLSSALFLSQAYTPILFIVLALSASAINLSEPTVIQLRNFSTKDLAWIIVLIGGSMVAIKMLAIVYS